MTPRPRLLFLAALVIPVLAAGIWMPAAGSLAVLLNVLIGAVALADWLITPPLSGLRLTRDVPATLSVADRNPVEIHVRNQSSVQMTAELLDECPQPGTMTGQPLQITVQPGQERTGRYHFQPHRRGRASFRAVHLRCVSRLGLWTMVQRRKLLSPVRIYPDIRAVYRYELMARRNRLEELGLKMYRLRGSRNGFRTAAGLSPRRRDTADRLEGHRPAPAVDQPRI